MENNIERMQEVIHHIANAKAQMEVNMIELKYELQKAQERIKELEEQWQNYLDDTEER